MLFFIDESGHPHPNDPAARPALGAIGIPLDGSAELARRVYRLKSDLGAADPNGESSLKASAIFNERTFRRVGPKWAYLREMIELGVNLPVVSFFVVMHRPDRPLEWAPGVLPAHYRFLIQRICGYMARERPGDRAILVFDSQDYGSDAKLSVAFQAFLFRHHEGRQWQPCIYETPMFVDSRITVGVQVADLFVSCVRQYQEADLGGRDAASVSAYQRELIRYHERISSTVYDCGDEGGQVDWGEYLMPKRYWGE
jgi:hypothetical protein